MGQIIEVPLNAGMNQAKDRTFQDPGGLQLTQNVRLDREGRLQVRPGFTALSSATMSTGTLNAYDLTNYRGRLVALGSQSGNSFPDDLFEWSSTVSKWRGTAGASTSVRLPLLTEVRLVGGLSDQQNSVNRVRLAAGAGYICAVVQYALGGNAMVHVFDPVTDQTLLLTSIAFTLVDVVFSGTHFYIVGIDANSDAAFTAFDPLADEALDSITVDTALTASTDIAANTFNGGWAYAVCHSGGVTAKTKSSAGAALVTIAVTATLSISCALAGGTLLSVCTLDTTNQQARL